MKKAFIFLLSATGFIPLQAQEKPPVIGDDYASLMAGDTVVVNVMLNDWCMEGHNMAIMNVLQGQGGSAVKIDSAIRYSSYFYYSGIDTVRYRLVDEDNELFSEEGYFVITVDNHGRDAIDVNNIDATFNSFGYQFCTLPGNFPEFNVPKGSGRKSIFSYSLWLGGLDAGQQLHVAGERYRTMGEDYFPGPVSGTYLNAQYIDWNRVSKISREEVEYHRAHWWETGYEPIGSIANWPAHGNVALGQAENLAPFHDWDNDGVYDPLQGDYPFMRGDQALWNVYNDDLDAHGETGGERIGAEVQMLAYAFDCPDDSLFNNTLFIRYTIINRSATAYHDFIITSFTDVDLGDPWDDYVGCDTLLNCYFVYNGDNNDESDFIFGHTLGYGISPPAQGIVFLNHPISSFIATNNFNNFTSDPSTPAGYYNIMNGLWRGGEPITYGGVGFGGDIPVKFQFPGNPQNPAEWSEVSAGNNPDDRRGICSAGPFGFLPGDTLKLDLAFVFARDYQGGHLSSVALLKERIASLKWYYDNDSIPCGKTWSSSPEHPLVKKQLSIFPNPCRDYLQIEVGDKLNNKLSYRITDLSGKLISSDGFEKRESINTSGLSKGVYLIEITGGGDVIKDKFIKK